MPVITLPLLRSPSPPLEHTVKETFGLLGGTADSAIWRNGRLLQFALAIDRETARAWLPPGLKPPANPLAHFFVGDFQETAFGVAYREAGIWIEATHWGQPVIHCPWCCVTDDSALIWGRELMGFPKKMAEIEIDYDGDEFDVTVVRRGQVLWELRGEIARDTDLDLATRLTPRSVVNLWGMPGTPAMLVKYDNGAIMKELHPARMDAHIPGGDHDPLGKLGVINRKGLSGYEMVGDLILPLTTRLPYWLRTMTRIRPVGLSGTLWMLRHYLLRSR